MDYKLYLEIDRKFESTLNWYYSYFRNNESYKEVIKKVRNMEEFKNVNLPDLDKFIIYYTSNVIDTLEESKLNPSQQKSIYNKQKNKLFDLVLEYTNRFENTGIPKRRDIPFREQQESSNPINEITFHRKIKGENVKISNPDIIIEIFFSIVDSGYFDKKLEEFKNTKSSKSYHAELYRSLAPFYLYLKEHFTNKTNEDIYTLLGDFLYTIGFLKIPSNNTLKNYLKNLNR